MAASGAFVWALLSFSYWFFQGHNPGETVFHIIVYAAHAVFVASWFVLSLGGLIGVVMPSVIKPCSQRTAFFKGAVLGVFAAIITVVLTSFSME